MSGKSNRKIAQVITDRFAVNFRQAERLVRTETSYVCNQAEMQSYKDGGIEEYEYLTAEDSRTCKLCARMNGQRFKVTEAEVGVNMPPLHPWCRCTTVAVVEEETADNIDFDILRSVGAKAVNYDVVDKVRGTVYHFVEGSKIQNATVFAGYKGVNPLRQATSEGLTDKFGGTPSKWQHCKGFGVLNVEGEEELAEIHWFQEETVGKVKFFVKKWLNES